MLGGRDYITTCDQINNRADVIPAGIIYGTSGILRELMYPSSLFFQIYGWFLCGVTSLINETGKFDLDTKTDCDEGGF